MHVEFTALPGRAEELESMLLEAAEATRSDDECLLYVISRSPDRDRRRR